MSKPRTEHEKLHCPSLEHNKDKLKMRKPSIGDIYQNRKGELFEVLLVANLLPVEGYDNAFPVTISYCPVSNRTLIGARHLIAWDMVMTFVRAKEVEPPCDCYTCESTACPCVCHLEKHHG